MIMTGYYARASEHEHKACSSRVHIVVNGNPACGYKPHATMQFCWNAHGVVMDYVECRGCLKWYEKLMKKKHEEAEQRAFRWKKNVPGRIRV